MAEHAGPQEAGAGQEWYTLRDVAGALGMSRQAVHACVQRGQLPAEQVEGMWRVSSSAVAEAVQAERRRFIGSGAVRILPVSAGASEDASGLSNRVSVIEAVMAQLSEDHRVQLAERDWEIAVLQERCARLTEALHHMVDLLGGSGKATRE